VKDILQPAQILAQELLAEAAENESQITTDLHIITRGKLTKDLLTPKKFLCSKKRCKDC